VFISNGVAVHQYWRSGCRTKKMNKIRSLGDGGGSPEQEEDDEDIP
jgi:hypothetical protein